MRKVCVLFLCFSFMLFAASAKAAFDLPSDLVSIEAEAFYKNSSIGGVVEIPSGVTSVGAGAFAYTRVYGLHLPTSVTHIGNHILEGADAAYIWLDSFSTLPSAVTDDVFYIFVNSGMDTEVSGKYINAAALISYDGMYYLEIENMLTALCPVNRNSAGTALNIPKVIDGKPVTSLSMLVMPGCTDIALTAPDYLTVPASLKNAVTYKPYMTMSTPEISGTKSTGCELEFSADVSEAYGNVNYTFKITAADGTVSTFESSSNKVYFTPLTSGTHTLHVIATDAIGDIAESTLTFNVTDNQNPVTYRALLIGNTYPDTYYDLQGPDNDIAAMQTMLDLYTGSDYAVTSHMNLSADGILNAIASAFSNADDNDVSLFFFSGTGTTDGYDCYLGGIGDDYYGPTYVNTSQLRAALDQIPGTKIVLVDAACSGALIGRSFDIAAAQSNSSSFTRSFISAFSTSSQSRNSSEASGLYAMPRGNLASPGYIVMTSCAGDEGGYTFTEDYVFFAGQFAYAVCYGSGYDMCANEFVAAAADSNKDNAISLLEAYSNAVYTIDTKFEGSPQSVQYYGDPAFTLWFK